MNNLNVNKNLTLTCSVTGDVCPFGQYADCNVCSIDTTNAEESETLYAKYDNGDEICWGFECKCKYQGKCDICPELTEYGKEKENE